MGGASILVVGGGGGVDCLEERYPHQATRRTRTMITNTHTQGGMPPDCCRKPVKNKNIERKKTARVPRFNG
jgi:hypothetical protein